jgi:dolichyl-phosphate-mannose-protein mannosyltransferase
MIDTLPDQGYFAKYTIVADQILAGHMPRERLLDFSPAYLWFVVALRAIGAGFHAIRTLQIVLLSVAAVLVAIAARRFGEIATYIAPLLLLGSRGALICATEVEPETLILVLNAAAIACLVEDSRPRLSGQRRAAVLHLLAGFFLGLSAACRPVALLVVVALAIFFGVRRPSRRSEGDKSGGMATAVQILAGAMIPVIAILIVNFSLTREVTLMDPGTVFYEGMNPSAVGYEGVQPRIVNDLERQSRDPDYLHVAYRVVAAQAVGHPVTRAESNRYWTGKALAFAREYPLAALTLTVRKFYLAIHSYEAYDLITMARKDASLSPWFFFPFGLIVTFAAACAVSRPRGIAPLVIFACCTGIVLVVFYVTARQRNAMLPALVILAAVGFTHLIKERVAIFAVVIIAILLGVNGPPQNEDRAGWLGIRNNFDLALELEQRGEWQAADNLLIKLQDEGYRPMRENRAVSSVAYYRAVAAAHMGQPREAVLHFLDQAAREAPGNEHVLAALGAEKILFELHDPFTARRALATARQQGM